MTFQSNARATFYWSSFSKKASLIALAVTFGTSFAVVSVPQQSLALAYVFLMNMVVLVGVVFWMTTKPPVNILGGARWYGLRDLWQPIVFGLAVLFAAIIVLLLVFGFPLQKTSIQENFRNVLLFAVFVGFVEEYMRWTWCQVLPYGIVTANLLWILLHPEVAPILSGQPWNPFFAVFALGFGLMATWAMWVYESPWRGGFNRYFGPVFAATVHAGYDALVIVWQVQIVVPGQGPTGFGPMFAPAMLALFPFTILLYLGAMTRGRKRAPVRGEPASRAREK